MNMSKFNQGFAGGVIIKGVPLIQTHPGKVFWVGNSATRLNNEKTASNTNRGGFLDPFSTIDYAVGQCAANRGDIIFVRPNHTETVSAAAGLDLDVAGIALIGLGSGANRPTINFTTAVGADMDVDAANITMVNFLFTGGIDALTGPIDVNAADFKLYDCEWRDVTGQATDVIVADANADRLTIDGYFHNGASAAGANSAIALTGMDNPVIRNFKLVGNFAVSAIDCRTTAVVDLDISNGYIWTKSSTDICIKDTITGSTGKVGPGLYFMLTDNAANITESITGATFHQFEDIHVCNLAGEIGMMINTTKSTDA